MKERPDVTLDGEFSSSEVEYVELPLVLTRQCRLYRVAASTYVEDGRVGPHEVPMVFLKHTAKTARVSEPLQCECTVASFYILPHIVHKALARHVSLNLHHSHHHNNDCT